MLCIEKNNNIKKLAGKCDSTCSSNRANSHGLIRQLLQVFGALVQHPTEIIIGHNRTIQRIECTFEKETSTDHKHVS